MHTGMSTSKSPLSVRTFFFFSLFISLGLKFLVSDYCRSTYFTLCLFRIAPAFQELVKQTVISSVSC